ncbi:MAG: autotransporter domain-containing protein [Xanthobacteraceae bacterium]
MRRSALKGPGPRALLATSSVAALLIGTGAPAAYAQPCGSGGIAIVGASQGSVSNPGPISCIYISNSTIGGSVTNSVGGTIATTAGPPSSTGITVTDSTITGTISNAGAISASGNGILITNDATVAGGISNSGTITANVNGIMVGGTAQSGSSVAVSNLGGGITNSGKIATSSGNGIIVGGKSLVGIFGTPSAVTVSTFAGSISNGGVIAAAGAGIVVGGEASGTGTSVSVSTFGGNIVNSGRITASGPAAIVVGGEANGLFASVTVGGFGGGITNSGTISASFATGILVGGQASGTVASVTISTFAGNISNAGTISVRGSVGSSDSGIVVGGQASGAFASVTIGTFGGGITNSGTISGHNGNDGILVGGSAFGLVAAVTISAFSGGITNSGTISGFAGGIVVGGFATGTDASVTISTFSGGITNSGTISAAFAGIAVNNLVNFTSGNISNSGKITARSSNGIIVSGVTNFTGNIINSGSIAVLFGSGIRVDDTATFTGNISNSGTIAAGFDGIAVGCTCGISTFAGSISNSGKITAGSSAIGIFVENVTSFLGNITNSGTISAGIGILVGAATRSAIAVTNAVFGGGTANGGITNSGMISAGYAGIFVGATADATYNLSSFGGGISNSGTISAGHYGIFVGAISASTVTISNFTGGITNNGLIAAPTGYGIFVGAASGGSTSTISTFTGNVVNSGTILSSKTAIYLSNISMFAGGITNNGMLSVSAASGAGIWLANIGVFTGNIANNGTISAPLGGIDIVLVNTFLGGITNTGLIAASGSGVDTSGDAVVIEQVTQFGSPGGGGITNFGTISSARKTAVIVGDVNTFYGNISNAGKIIGATGIVIGPAVTFDAASAIVNTGVITGTGGVAINASAATSPVSVTIAGGAINGNMLGAGLASNDTLDFALTTGKTFTYNSSFENFDAVSIDSGTVVLNGASNSAATLTVSNGGTLAGTGSIDPLPTTVVEIQSGGIFAPGTPSGFGTFTIAGTLTFDAGSFYAINIAPGAGNNSSAIVNGTANLNGNGTVVVTPEPGHYNDAIYTILSPTTRNGTFVPTVTVTGTFVDGTPTLDYATNGPNDVDLDVTGFSLVSAPAGTNLNQNQQNALNGINGGILDSPANVPLLPAFLNLSNLSGSALGNALTELDGQDGTGAQTSAFQLMQDFLNMLSDPTAGGGGDGGTSSGPQQFAPDDQASLPPDIALAYAHALHQKPTPSSQPQDFEQRWSAWASGFGGSSTIDGNTTVGSSNVTATDYGYAAGMTYHATPSTSYGFALAGGGTNWNLAQSLGSGRSDSFQAGVYGTSHFGPAYLSGALAFANHWFSTSRIALGDNLTASFQGQSYAARGEAGYRYGLPIIGYIIGVTPYAALQVQDFHTPGYSETDLTGGGFGLTYAAMNATDTRSELGARFDNLTVWDGMPLVLRGRLAWAHDWVSDPTLGAVFQALPGSNFTVNGAAPPKNSVLTTAAAELHLNANWTAMAKFDGDFGSGAQTYAGTGTLKYSW